MQSSFGKNIKVEISGGSHEKEIRANISGFPKGFPIEIDKLQEFMDRRAPGKANDGFLTTSRKESDIPEFIEGMLKEDDYLITNGETITLAIKNEDIRPSDYEKLKSIPRPGHADYTSMVKYGQTFPGGGFFSGRMTAALCAAGALALQLMETRGTKIEAKVYQIGNLKASDFSSEEEFRTAYLKLIEDVSLEGDSIGGIVECKVICPPLGIGGPMFDGLESILSQIYFGIPAVKGVEFGLGFEAAKLKGSENNDTYSVLNGNVKLNSNNAGGILGGISDGEEIVARLAFKPTPSISKKQKTVNMENMTETEIEIDGRHDPCIVLRALPVVEAATALGILDAMLER